MAGLPLSLHALAILLLGALGLAPSAAAAQAEQARPAARLDPSLVQAALEIERPTCFVGERCRLRLKLALSRRAVDSSWVLPYQRFGDVPVELRLPWLEQLSAQPASQGQSALGNGALQMIVNGKLWTLQRWSADSDSSADWLRVQLVLEWNAGRPGVLDLKGGSLHTFEGERSAPPDLFQRPPALARELWLELPEAAIRVLELPSAQRPIDFSGAVGQFELRAQVDRAQIASAQTLELHLWLEGDGDLRTVLAPRLDPMPGLAVQGMLEQPWSKGRHFVFQLQVLDARVRRIAPVAFCYFDPAGEGAYRYAKSKAIALEVTEPGPLSAAPQAAAIEAGGAPASSLGPWIAGALTALVLAGVVLWTRTRGRQAPNTRKP